LDTKQQHTLSDMTSNTDDAMEETFDTNLRQYTHIHNYTDMLYTQLNDDNTSGATGVLGRLNNAETRIQSTID